MPCTIPNIKEINIMSEVVFVNLTASQTSENAPKSKKLAIRPLTPTKQKERASAWRKMLKYEKSHGPLHSDRLEFATTFADADGWHYYTSPIAVIMTKDTLPGIPQLITDDERVIQRTKNITYMMAARHNILYGAWYGIDKNDLQRIETAAKQKRVYIKVYAFIYTPEYLYDIARIIDPYKKGIEWANANGTSVYLRGQYGIALLATCCLSDGSYAYYLKNNNLTD